MRGFLGVSARSQRCGLWLLVGGMHALLLILLAAAKPSLPHADNATMTFELFPLASATVGAAAPRPTVQPAEAMRPSPRREPGARAANLLDSGMHRNDAYQAASAYSPQPSVSAPERIGEVSTIPAVMPGVSERADDSAPVSAARFDAAYLNNPRPPYPSISRRMGESGRVVLRVRVTPEGQVGDIDVQASSGSSRLDESALHTVRQWKFVPARRGETAVASWVLVPIVFKLES